MWRQWFLQSHFLEKWVCNVKRSCYGCAVYPFFFLPCLPKCFCDRVCKHVLYGAEKMQFSRILLVHSNCSLLSNWKLVIHKGNLWISLVKSWNYKLDDQDLIAGRSTAFFQQCCCSGYQNVFMSRWKYTNDVVVLLIL